MEICVFSQFEGWFFFFSFSIGWHTHTLIHTSIDNRLREWEYFPTSMEFHKVVRINSILTKRNWMHKRETCSSNATNCIKWCWYHIEANDSFYMFRRFNLKLNREKNPITNGSFDALSDFTCSNWDALTIEHMIEYFCFTMFFFLMEIDKMSCMMKLVVSINCCLIHL